MQTPPCEVIENTLGALYSCVPRGKYVRIRTPFLYPDGDVVDVFLRGDVDTLSDLGETTRWLRSQSLSPRRSPKQRRLLDDVCQTHGIEFFKGMLTVRVAADAEFAQALTRLCNAIIAVSDLWFTYRTRMIESTTDEVEDLLKDRSVPFERNQNLVGRSLKSWRIDFHTRAQSQSALVQVMSTGSRSAATNLVKGTLAAWYDLSHLKVGKDPLHFVSLFDDSLDVWRDEDFRLLDDLSNVVVWSQREEFLKAVGAP